MNPHNLYSDAYGHFSTYKQYYCPKWSRLYKGFSVNRQRFVSVYLCSNSRCKYNCNWTCSTNMSLMGGLKYLLVMDWPVLSVGWGQELISSMYITTSGHLDLSSCTRS